MSQAIASWSGGKDSCLALYKATLQGFKVSYLINFVSKEGRHISHGINAELITAQSRAIGIPIIQKEVTWGTYENVFKETIRELKQMGVEAVVFGDIDFREHKEWIERVCAESEVTPIEPLWGLDPEKILKDFMSAGFEAIVISVKADLFGEEWLGRKVDESLVKDLRKLQSTHNIHICGELGEYHTFVMDGPIFRKRIKIIDAEKVLRHEYYKRRLLDIRKYVLDVKEK